MIKFTQKGDLSVVARYLQRLSRGQIFAVLNKYGEMGVSALAAATPVEEGETAAAWSYSIKQSSGYYSIRWHNSHVNDGVPIAVILQYGHGTGTGGYVQGRDYIMPAIRPVFDQIAAEAWREVTRV